MAEVIGLIASIVNILDGVDKTRVFLRDNVNSSQSLREELLPILGKLIAFKGILQGLQLECELDESNSSRLHVIAYVAEPLRACENATEIILVRLEKACSRGNNTITFGKALDKKTLKALRILDETKPVLDLALSADQATILKSLEAYTRSIATDLKTLSDTSQEHFKYIKDLVLIQDAEHVDAQEQKFRREIMDWVTSIDYRSNLSASLGHVPPENSGGDWLFRSPEFQQWQEVSDQRLILLTGNSGAGKTVLSAKAVSNLLSESTQPNSGFTVLYYFFDFNDAAKQQVESMIRCLIHQMLCNLDKIPDNVCLAFKQRNATLVTTAGADLTGWVTMFRQLLHQVPQMFVVVDALDECRDEHQALLVSTLRTVLGDVNNMTKWFLTCRPNSLFSALMTIQGCCHISMQPKLIDQDIQRYLSLQLENDAALSSLTQRAKYCITASILTKSGGMFRWAQCQLDTLRNLKDRRMKNVERVLEKLPADIFKTYDRILDSLSTTDERILAVRILVFVCYGKRPVTVNEAAEFAILEDGMTDVHAEDRFDSVHDLTSLLGIMVEERNGVLLLSHKTVQDYLFDGSGTGLSGMSENLRGLLRSSKSADSEIGKRCLQYLSFQQQPAHRYRPNTTTKTPNSYYLNHLSEAYPLLSYAATQWQKHLRRDHAQLELAGQIRQSIDLANAPNLWKAWILLQPADIWENQLSLGRIVCETALRSSVAPAWCWNFWNTRQVYRTHEDSYRSSGHVANDEVSTTPPDSWSKYLSPHESSWAGWRVSRCKCMAVLRNHIIATDRTCGFDAGDVVLAEYQGDDESDIIVKLTLKYQNGLADRIGLVHGKSLENNALRLANVLGLPLYHLAITLLEIAMQSSLKSNRDYLLQITTQSDLQAHLATYDDTVKVASMIMGDSYAAVVRNCFLKVTFICDQEGLKLLQKTDRHFLFPSAWPIFLQQDILMKDIYGALVAMTKSGFRASRQIPPKRGSRQISGNISKESMLQLKVDLDRQNDRGGSRSPTSESPCRRGTISTPHTDHSVSDVVSTTSADGPIDAEACPSIPNDEHACKETTEPNVQLPLSLEIEALGHHRGSFQKEHTEALVSLDAKKLWMTECCQSLLENMAMVITDADTKREMRRAEEEFRRLSEARQTALLYLFSSDATLEQQYFLAQIILQRLENKPVASQGAPRRLKTRVVVVEQDNISTGSQRAAGQASKAPVAGSGIFRGHKGDSAPAYYPLGSRFSEIHAPVPSSAAIAGRWSTTSGPSYRSK